MRKWLLPFRHAWSGIRQAVKDERHMKVHLVIAFLVTVATFVFPLTGAERSIILLMNGLVITAELFNTAFERTVDLVTEEWHPLAKAAKDIASGAVLVMAFTAVLIAICIFVPYLVQ